MKMELKLEQTLEQQPNLERPKRNFRVRHDSRNPQEAIYSIKPWVDRFLENYLLFDQKGEEPNLLVRAVYKLNPLEFFCLFGTTLPRPPEALYAQIMPLNLRKRIAQIQPRKGSIYQPDVEFGRLNTYDYRRGGGITYHIDDARLEILFKKEKR